MSEIPLYPLLWQYLEHWASLFPNLPAIVFNERTISYGELNKMTDRFAKALISLGINKGDRVLTILPQRPEFTILFLGACKIGAITVPMDIRYKKEEIRHLSHVIEPKVIVSIDQFRGNDFATILDELKLELSYVKYYVLVGESESLPTALSFDYLLSNDYKQLEQELKRRKRSLRDEDDLIIVFTGGTTGKPKGAILSHKNVVSMNLGKQTAWKLSHDDRMLVHLPPSHVGGSTDSIAQAIVSGVTMVMLDYFRPDDTLKIIEKEKVTILGQVPTMYRMEFSLPDFEKYDLSSLRLLWVSGDKISSDLLEKMFKLCKPVVISYGCTEADGVTVTRVEDSKKILKRPGYVGKPCQGYKIKIVDENRKILPPKNVGEIAIRGPIVSKGYYKMPEETANCFDSEGWFYTGDLGFLDRNGRLYITGRKKEIIRTGSYTVLPKEIEDVLIVHPKVQLAAVVGVPDKIYGEVVWAFVVPKQGAKLTTEELKNLCTKKLSDYKIPRRFLIRDSIPMTRTGKIARKELVDEARNIKEKEEKLAN